MIVIKGPIQVANGNYLTAVNGGGLGGPDAGTGLVALHSDATYAHQWETFTLKLSPPGQAIGPGMTFGLLTFSGENFVTAVGGGGIGGPSDGTCPFHTDSVVAGTPEQFTLNINDTANPPTVTIQTASGNYVTAVNGGGVGDAAGGDAVTPVRTSDSQLEGWQIFKALGAPAPAQLSSYNFTLNSLQVNSKRTNTWPGTGEDTDYVGFSLTVGNKAPVTLTKAMGNLSTDSYPIELTFPNIVVGPNDNVLFNYHVVNSSKGPESTEQYLTNTLESAVEAGVKALAQLGGNAAAAALGAMIGSFLGLAIPVPLLGSALGALGGWLIADAWGFLFPCCDGPVAAGYHVWSSSYLQQATAGGAITVTENHPGVNSPSGCGGNSNYNVTWTVSRA